MVELYSSPFAVQFQEAMNMKPLEELELPPWTKWKKYGIFPTKMIIHLCLVILVTAQAFVLNESFSTYSRSMSLAVADVFFPQGWPLIVHPNY